MSSLPLESVQSVAKTFYTPFFHLSRQSSGRLRRYLSGDKGPLLIQYLAEYNWTYMPSQINAQGHSNLTTELQKAPKLQKKPRLLKIKLNCNFYLISKHGLCVKFVTCTGMQTLGSQRKKFNSKVKGLPKFVHEYNCIRQLPIDIIFIQLRFK